MDDDREDFVAAGAEEARRAAVLRPLVQAYREWAKLGGHAAALRYVLVNLPSRTAARTTATLCAPLGDHLMRRRFPMRVLPMSSTQPSARDEEIGRPLRYRQP